MKWSRVFFAIALGGAAGLVWLWRKLDPRTPLHYRLPERNALLPLTPECVGGDAELTEPAIEGPMYIPNTPERRVIRDHQTPGTPLVIEGRVLTPKCQPIAGAVLDFWNCDGNGVYETEGFRLRGHQFTLGDGSYWLETVKPGDYHQFGIHRTPHVHVKVQGPGTSLLTTQLFFPGELLNDHDLFIKESLIMDPTGHFDFVIA